MTYTKGLNKSSYNLRSEVGKRPSWNPKDCLNCRPGIFKIS